MTSKSGENAGVSVWSPTGEKIGQITGSGTSVGSFTSACGVAVDQSDGSLYIGDKGSGAAATSGATGRRVRRPSATPTTPSPGSKRPGSKPVPSPSTAASTSSPPKGPKARSTASGGRASAPPLADQCGTQIQESARALAVDPSTHDLYVDEGTRSSSSTAPANNRARSGAGAFTGSRGVAINPAEPARLRLHPVDGRDRRIRVRIGAVSPDRQPR